MCFSTEASFGAAVILGTIGSYTLSKCVKPSCLFLASIPLLFALQQLSEGLVWLHFSQAIGSPIFHAAAAQAFLFFAFLVWPIWIPLSLAAVEQIHWRRILLYCDLVCGILLSLVNLIDGLRQDIGIQIIHHSIQYQGNAFPQTYLYPLIVLLPCFLSSLKKMWIFGILIVVSYLATDYYYQENFVSVWCFFAAIISLTVYKIMKDNEMFEISKRSPI